MKGHPVIGALVGGTLVAFAYGLYRKSTNQPVTVNYWPFTAGALVGYLISK